MISNNRTSQRYCFVAQVNEFENESDRNPMGSSRMRRGWSKKVRSKFGVYKFQVFREFQLETGCLLFLCITSRLSMVKSLFLHCQTYGFEAVN
jgi:hypothetical protein